MRDNDQFNIFMKIPYDWREQYELPHIKASNSPGAGNFEFLYTDTSGDIEQYSYRLDPTCEGLMIFFPSEINLGIYHQIYLVGKALRQTLTPKSMIACNMYLSSQYLERCKTRKKPL